MFTIILADADADADADTDGIAIGVNSTSLSEIQAGSNSGNLPPTKSPPEYLIHRSLLATISPELGKHTNNDMKEGKEGRMILHEVNEATMERFLQWAYQGHYTV